MKPRDWARGIAPITLPSSFIGRRGSWAASLTKPSSSSRHGWDARRLGGSGRPRSQRPARRRHSKNFIRGTLKQFAENNGFHAGIWHEGRLAGVVGYHAIDWEHRSTSLGYWLGQEFEGKGLATNACRALVDHAFEELGLNRVSIACATEKRGAAPYPRG
jgi:RimJ/RimL family protein N-acetyltransferase